MTYWIRLFLINTQAHLPFISSTKKSELNGTNYPLKHLTRASTTLLLGLLLLHMWLQLILVKSWFFGSHIETPAAHRPLSSSLLWETSRCRNRVDYIDLVWHGLLEQRECQNVTNLTEPLVPFVLSHLHTKEALHWGGGQGWFNNNTVVSVWNIQVTPVKSFSGD